ncbi:MAG: putative porin [Terriglobales bacterium]
MKLVFRLSVVLLLASSLLAQTPTTAKKAPRRPAVNAELQALKDAVAAQQQQIQALQQQLQQTNQLLQQNSQQFQQTQQQLQQAQQAAADAQQKAAVESTAASRDAVNSLSSRFADVQTMLTNNAVSAQDEEKRVSALESTLGRFRWTGDMRVRGESYFQKYSGCTLCNDRNRARIRVRFGFEGKLSEDFIAGVALASGTLGDPTTTNETLTNNFDRKTIALDRGFITYNPVAHRWLSLTGGKFAYTWQRTSMTFDPDINPEGFVAKFSKDVSNVPAVKNVNIQFMQLLYNEVAGNSKTALGISGNGHDSFAVGGQVGGRLQPLSFWTLTPSFTILNFRNPDALLNSSAFAVGATNAGGSITIGGTTYPIVVTAPGEGPGCAKIAGGNTAPQPASNSLVGGCAFAANGVTNSTYLDANGNAHFLSGFLYADLILNNQFKTPLKRFPFNLLLEYEDNLNASDHPFDFTVKGAVPNPSAVEAAKLGKQSHAYLTDFSLGQLKNRGDIQVGYAFERSEQDAIIASWGESDQRAPTNILQHRFYALWRVAPNTTASFTWWHGRTLNPFLQNAVLANGLTVNTTPGVGVLTPGKSGQEEPWLNRLQFDLIYTF